MLSIRSNANENIAITALASANSTKFDAMRKMSSGLRVDRASDDTSAFRKGVQFKSQELGVKAYLRNANDAISMLEYFEAWAGRVRNTFTSMRELAAVASTGTVNNVQRKSMDDQYYRLGMEWARDFGGLPDDPGVKAQWNTITMNSHAANGSVGPSLTVKVDTGPLIPLVLKCWHTVDFSTDTTRGVYRATAGATAAQNANQLLHFDRLRRLGGANNEGTANSVSMSNIQTQNMAQRQVAILDRSLEGVAIEISAFASYINMLTIAKDNLLDVGATQKVSGSRIVDADFAVETSNLAKSQILALAATETLSQAQITMKEVIKLLE